MGYENDFAGTEPVEIDIEGRKFKYKPVTGGDENSWLSDIMVVTPGKGANVVNWGMYNKKKLQNITQVPYDAADIKKILGVEKTWVDLTTDQRYDLLSRLKPGLFDKLINGMKKIDAPDEKTIKNSQA